jgi:hypothetical protein
MSLLSCASLAIAAPRMSGHGEMIVKCHMPVFFDEIPADNSEVNTFGEFKFKTSENTDINTLKVWVNNQSIDVNKQKQLSGRHLVTGKLKQPLTTGKAWIKVISESSDGCHALQSWYVTIK